MPEPYESDGELFFNKDEVKRYNRIEADMDEHLRRCPRCQKWFAHEGNRIVDQFSRLEANQSPRQAHLPIPQWAVLKRVTQVVSSEVRKAYERYKKKLN
jgi:predicted anti-sigma-YlaC factor YlaD